MVYIRFRAFTLASMIRVPLGRDAPRSCRHSDLFPHRCLTYSTPSVMSTRNRMPMRRSDPLQVTLAAGPLERSHDA